VLEVTDQGEGIPNDELPYIFDRFYRARSSDGTRGSGLGLAIVKAIAETHNGQVEVQTLAGRGTTFRADLPGFQPEPATRLAPVAA
jgi:two-component system sensor histidine kinase ResE